MTLGMMPASSPSTVYAEGAYQQGLDQINIKRQGLWTSDAFWQYITSSCASGTRSCHPRHHLQHVHHCLHLLHLLLDTPPRHTIIVRSPSATPPLHTTVVIIIIVCCSLAFLSYLTLSMSLPPHRAGGYPCSRVYLSTVHI